MRMPTGLQIWVLLNWNWALDSKGTLDKCPHRRPNIKKAETTRHWSIILSHEVDNRPMNLKYKCGKTKEAWNVMRSAFCGPTVL